jgi:hypothetical protein
MCLTSFLLSPPSILFKTNANIRILGNFIFQLNTNFISNLNLTPSRLLLPPCIPMPILPQNQSLAATQVPPRHWCLSSLPPLFESPPFKLNPVSAVRSQGPNHRRKNHVESHFVASTINHQSLTVVSHRGCDFFRWT